MRTEGFFDWLGQALGSVIRFIIDVFSGVLGGIGDAVHDFLQGMARAIGMDDSYISFVVLVVGLILLYAAVRAFMRRSIVGGVIWLVLGLMVMSWLIR
ncbi:hypothetical protein IQ22_01200 [Pseudomonas duriflava]|uniref:Uncharacterized protein n=1 Tax=Pseudomonas duriflava TaxID=459528 RepID=A0A562QIZ9_9PSED|nr:hypothetical protein [Pseudomonas duriflava]TWI56748.1 hypothetical protein IQ22_01200 [Pseudomonas duriflava]